MRIHWESLYESFIAVVRTADERSLACDDGPLAAYPDLGALFAYLVDSRHDLDERDRVLAALVLRARHGAHRPLATALLWLALWPGLCGVYRRRLRWRACPDEVVSAIAFAFTSLVAEMDTARVNRVAATLVRSTERAVVAGLRGPTREVPFEEPTLDRLGVAPDRFEHELRHTHRWLTRVLGPDAELVVAVAILDEPHAEAAARIGTTPVAARKRYQRALARVRGAYAQDAVA